VEHENVAAAPAAFHFLLVPSAKFCHIEIRTALLS